VPLGKDDNPNNRQAGIREEKPTSDADARKATNKAIDAGAGAPEGAMRQAAEELPEKDDVQKAIKEGMLATDAQTEAKAKVKVVEASPNADETPSGIALKKTAGISDDVKRGEEYSRIKSAVRHGYVPASEKDLEVKK
jgi:hypothetical protein